MITEPVTSSVSAPTRVRYQVVAMATALAMITYLDRVCIAKLAPDIMRDLELSKIEMGYVFSSFALAYAMFEIPTAWWADRSGTHSVLTRIVVWWSCFTAATATAAGYASLLVLRFLFGAGEAGAWPCVARTFSRWIPSQERGTVQGVFFAGAHLVGGLTPTLIVLLLPFMNWRAVFVLFGSVGFIWAIAWHIWFRDDPTEHSAVNAAEAAYIVANRPADVGHVAGASYWWRLLRDRNVLALCIMYASNSMIFYFCITWLPTYLQERHGFEATALGFFAGLPLLVSVPSDLFGGVVADRVAARFWPSHGPLHGRRDRVPRVGVRADCRGPVVVPRHGGRADFHRDGGLHVHAWRRMGHLQRSRPQSHRRRGRHDEHGRSDCKPRLPAPCRVLRCLVQQLELSALCHGRHVPDRGRLLAGDRSDAAGLSRGVGG
jgi:sugar phosphate permease